MDFLFRNTSHPAQWMASVLNVHPCITQAILALSHAGEARQPSNAGSPTQECAL